MDTVSFMFPEQPPRKKGSIHDNVKLGRPEATEEEVLAALRAASAWTSSRVPRRYHTVIGTGVYLSGGEQQRISIARILERMRRSSCWMRRPRASTLRTRRSFRRRCQGLFRTRLCSSLRTVCALRAGWALHPHGAARPDQTGRSEPRKHEGGDMRRLPCRS